MESFFDAGLAKLASKKTRRRLIQLLTKLIQDSQKISKRKAKRLAKEAVGALLQSAECLSETRNLDSGLSVVRFEANKQIDGSNDHSAATTDSLQQQKMLALRNLAYGASHEINNPLANIATRAQSLLTQENDPKNPSFDAERQFKLGVIYEQALRAHEMVSDLMLFANPPEINRQTTDLKFWLPKLIGQVEELLVTPREFLFGQGNKRFDLSNQILAPIDFRVVVGWGVGEVYFDPTQIAVALKAIIRNSIESLRGCGQTGTIELRISKQDSNGWRFTITDDGPGIPEKIKDSIFDPFFSGREAGRGLGFGLSKAWRIADLHGGQLKLNSDFSEGTQFELILPRTGELSLIKTKNK